MMAPTTTIERAAKERPILMSAPMVRQILDGKKTQTRRVIQPQPLPELRAADGFWSADEPELYVWKRRITSDVSVISHARCPYGAAGDRLYVKEAWRCPVEHDRLPPRDVPPDTSLLWIAGAPRAESMHRELGWGRYRHARFMPRWASRLTLDVIDVRVERLHDITDKDILAEGVTVPIVAKMTGIPWAEIPDLFSAWRLGWIHINGAESWESNPWVWRVAFRRVESNAD